MIRHIALGSALVLAALLTTLVFLLPQPETPAPDSVADAETSGALLIENVRLLEGDTLSAPVSVLIRDGRIAELGTTGQDPAAQVIDGAGATLLPGLIDAHTHSYGSSLEDALRFGVTVNLDMFADRSLLPLARQARENLDATRAADLWSAGMLATAPGGHGTQYGVAVEPLEDVAAVPAWVAERKAEGSDYIKLVYMPTVRAIPSIDRDLARAVIEAAHGEGLMALAHISTLEGARHMVEDGIDGLVHVFADQPVDDDFIALARDRGVFVIPTLAVIEAISSEAGLAELISNDDRDRLLSPMQRQTLGARFGADIPGFRLELALENVRRLHDAGVPILAGSDAPNPGTAQGLSLHRELQLLVRAGLSEAEALAAATTLPARRFDLDDRGRIEEGARADLLLVDGNPLEDIARTLSLVAVYKNGHRVERVPGEAGAAPVLSTQLLGDFEAGLVAPRGFGWTGTDDGMVNGASEVSLERVPGADADAGHVLRVDAVVRSGFPYPWAGGAVMSTEGGDLSDYRAVQFAVRGTPGTYRLMGFNLGAMGIPPTVNFDVTDEWRTLTVAIADLDGLDPRNFMGFAWVAGPAPGESTLFLDDVRLLK